MSRPDFRLYELHPDINCRQLTIVISQEGEIECECEREVDIGLAIASGAKVELYFELTKGSTSDARNLSSHGVLLCLTLLSQLA